MSSPQKGLIERRKRGWWIISVSTSCRKYSSPIPQNPAAVFLEFYLIIVKYSHSFVQINQMATQKKKRRQQSNSGILTSQHQREPIAPCNSAEKSQYTIQKKSFLHSFQLPSFWHRSGSELHWVRDGTVRILRTASLLGYIMRHAADLLANPSLAWGEGLRLGSGVVHAITHSGGTGPHPCFQRSAVGIFWLYWYPVSEGREGGYRG